MKKEKHRYAEARGIFERILPFADDDIKSRIQKRIPMTWYYEGADFIIDQKFSEALVCMEKARDGFYEIGETKNEIDAWCQIGSIMYYTYNLTEAMNAYKHAYNIADSIHYDAKLMSILGELRNLNEQLGDSEQMLLVGKKIDSLANVSKDNEMLFNYYCQQGDRAKSQGNLELAEQWYMKSDSYICQFDDNDISSVRGTYYSKLLNLYSYAEKWEKALKYARLFIGVSQHTQKEDDKDYYMSYGMIANIYKKKGDSIRCFQCIDTLFMSLDKQDEPRVIYGLYLTRALCYSKFKNYSKALADYKTADSVLATKYGEDDGDRIMLLPIIGGMESKLKHHAEAERMYTKYAKSITKLYGENNSEYINALGYLANAEGFAGHIEMACTDYTVAVGKLKQQIQDRLPYFTEAEREGYWSQVSELIQNMTPFALEAKEHQTAFTRACYDGLILSKAFLLESERSTFDLIKNHGTEEDLHDFKKISAMQAKIKEWGKMGSLYSDSILKLTLRAKELETKLSDQCRSYGDITAFMGIDYNKIRERLCDEDVLIDFTDFVSESRGRMYAAYFVNNKQENPLLQKLFAESEIDSMQVSQPHHFYKSPYAEKMYQLLWEPFKDKVKESATVYYVPSQMLFQIALESLPMEDGTLLGEHYHFVRLSSARELVNLKNNIDFDFALGRREAVLYGGLQYDLEKKVMEKEAEKYEISPLLAFRGGQVRGDSIFHDLPNSLIEIIEIEKSLTANHVVVKPYSGIKGTEESLIYLSGKAPAILHIATHGFYYTPTEAQKYNYLRGYSDAMSLSGIVMAGGNAAWLGKDLPKGVLSGIMTAADISRLDLNGVELLVLSACHSGRGNATSEGLYGLQRAFKKAGTKTMVLSLWEVNDVVGTEFMTAFYKYLSDKDNHWNKRAAFEQAKNDIRVKYKSPYYWACFVMLD